MVVDWQAVEGSTLVAAAAYDPAAERIFVRLHSGLASYYDGCDPREWAAFMLPSTSKGEYLTQVLAHKSVKGPIDGSSADPRPLQTDGVRRAIYLNAFRPAQEMSEPRFFAGRQQQVQDLVDALRVTGSCPLIFGDRGLGKSSLAVQAQLIAMGDRQLLEQIGAADRALLDDETFLTLFVTCSDSLQHVDQLIQMIINAAEDVVPAGGDPVSALVDRTTRRKVTLKFFETETTRKYEAKKERPGFENLSLIERLQRVIRLLNEVYQGPVLILVDELDRLRDKSGLASLLKALSTADLKFLLVGIAQDWSDLLLDHASIERQISPVKVTRMTRPELAEIVDRAQLALEDSASTLRFDGAARVQLVDIAGGFPWFVHVLGQASLMRAVEESAPTVTREHVTKSMRDLVRNRFAQHFADSYQRAVRDSVQRELTLRVLAHWPTADIPTASVYPILRGLGVSNPAAYRGHLMRDQYGPVLMAPGYQDRGLVRFRNEMFRQYVFLVPSLYSGVDENVAAAMRRY